MRIQERARPPEVPWLLQEEAGEARTQARPDLEQRHLSAVRRGRRTGSRRHGRVVLHPCVREAARHDQASPRSRSQDGPAARNPLLALQQRVGVVDDAGVVARGCRLSRACRVNPPQFPVNVTAYWDDFDYCQGVTYFVLDRERNAVKIGQTVGSIETRLGALQCGNPSKLALLLTLPGVELEDIYHEWFATERIRGEWFEYSQHLFETLKLSQQMRDIAPFIAGWRFQLTDEGFEWPLVRSQVVEECDRLAPDLLDLALVHVGDAAYDEHIEEAA